MQYVVEKWLVATVAMRRLFDDEGESGEVDDIGRSGGLIGKEVMGRQMNIKLEIYTVRGPGVGMNSYRQ